MRVARVITNETCDLACRFCDARRPHERASVAAASAVLARADAALAAGAEDIVLTGGEPTRRRDLPALVAELRRRGAQRIVLETSATRIDAALARALADAGLHVARVHVPGVGAALDAITGSPDTWPALQAGWSALAEAGIPIEASVPIVRDTAEHVATIASALAGLDTPPARIWARVPIAAPDPTALADRDAIDRGLHALADAGRRTGIPVSLDPATPVPPCTLTRLPRIAHLFSLTAGGATRPDHARPLACAPCVLADRCPGIPTAAPALTGVPPRPLTDDDLRRRLTVIATPQAQAERELVTRERWRRPDGSTALAHVVRIAFHCNQACRFCFVSTHLPPVPHARVAAAIEQAAREGAIVVLSGGEPTLDPRLPEYAALAKRLGVPTIELQTNAVRLARPGLAEALARAGVDIAFVSLHGATAAVCERVTRAPGTFADTLAGLDALARTRIAIRINFVTCADNHQEFPAVVDLVAARWPGTAITLSFVGTSTDLVPRTPDLVPRYADVMPSLAEGLRRATAHGIPVAGFDSMCGLPLCLVPGEPAALRQLAQLAQLAEIADGEDGGEFVHPPPCDACVLKRRCFGLRRGYAELHGWRELSPIVA